MIAAHRAGRTARSLVLVTAALATAAAIVIRVIVALTGAALALTILRAGRNDLAVPAKRVAPVIGEVIDAGAETARLQKALARVEKDASGLRGRLSNPKFAQNADPEVIEETRGKLADLDEDIARTRAALEQLRTF